ncbi:DnaB-like helicase C-terminal domain-containing protein [Bacillus sp. IITD106]|nr:DnaB-like helicase C-terminal domain-containing protein [Bacillus sp. IITD106]
MIRDPKHRAIRQAKISEISRMLKTMAQELNIVIIAISQLSRGVKSRDDKPQFYQFIYVYIKFYIRIIVI